MTRGTALLAPGEKCIFVGQVLVVMTVIPREKLLGDTVHPNPYLTLLGKSLGSTWKSSQRKSRTHVSVTPALDTGKDQIQYLGALCMLPFGAGIADNCESHNKNTKTESLLEQQVLLMAEPYLQPQLILILKTMCIYVCAHECRCLRIPEKGIRLPGDEVTGSCKSLRTGAGNQTCFLCKSRAVYPVLGFPQGWPVLECHECVVIFGTEIPLG